MTNHPNRTWAYAVQSPRGFSNELTVHAFATADDRDTWVERHADDGDVNSASMGARAVTPKQATNILHARGDAATRTYHAIVAHGEAKNCPLRIEVLNLSEPPMLGSVERRRSVQGLAGRNGPGAGRPARRQL